MSFDNEQVTIRTGRLMYGTLGTSSTISNKLFTNNQFNRVAVPHYRQLIAMKLDASSNYLRRESTIYQDQPIYTSITRKASAPAGWSQAINWVYPFKPIVSIPANSLTTTADDIALKRLKGRLANDQGQFKALVPLAELKETYGLLNQAMSATEGLLKSLLALKHGKVRNVTSAASKAWLTFSFGISPTINDLNSLYSSINSYLSSVDVVRDYQGKYETSWTSTGNDASATTACSGVSLVWPNSQIFHEYQVQYTAGVRMNVRSANNYGIGDHFGLNFGEIIPTFWELIPFSWVVDYFSTTGDFISDTFTGDSGNTIYCCKSVKYKAKCRNDVAIVNNSPATNQLLSSPHPVAFKYDAFIFQRSVLSSIPHRAFRIKSASEISANSVKRLLNLASILLS